MHNPLFHEPVNDGHDYATPFERMGVPHLPWLGVVSKMSVIAIAVDTAVRLVALGHLGGFRGKAEKAAQHAFICLVIGRTVFHDNRDICGEDV